MEELVLAGIQQVGGGEAQREVVADAFFHEQFQIVAIADGHFFGQDAAEGITLLAVGRAEAGGQVRQILDEAEVIDRSGLIVEATLAKEIRDLALEPGVIQEHAGVVQTKGRKRRGKIELDTIDLAVADIGRGEQPAFRLERQKRHRFFLGQVFLVHQVFDVILVAVESVLAGFAGVDQLDQIRHVAVEEVHADHATLAQSVLEAQIDAVGNLLIQQWISDVIVVAVFAVEQCGDQFVEVRSLHGSGQRQTDAIGVGHIPLQVQ